jgi:hypothetical protein
VGPRASLDGRKISPSPNLLYTFFCANFLVVAVSEPAKYRFLTFQVPNLKFFFRCLVIPEYHSTLEAIHVNVL